MGTFQNGYCEKASSKEAAKRGTLLRELFHFLAARKRASVHAIRKIRELVLVCVCLCAMRRAGGGGVTTLAEAIHVGVLFSSAFIG